MASWQEQDDALRSLTELQAKMRDYYEHVRKPMSGAERLAGEGVAEPLRGKTFQ
jgi:hypothetical protein